MGPICPCQRDTAPASPKQSCTPILPSTYPHRSQSLVDKRPKRASRLYQNNSFQVTLRADESLIRLVGPISQYYTLGSPLKSLDRFQVLTAEYKGTKQRCLIKVVEKDEFECERKVALFQMLKKIDHPYVARVYEVCQDDKNIYIVSERTAGSTLDEYLVINVYLSEDLAALVMHQVLSALAHCHSISIVHGRLSLKTLSLLDTPSDFSIAVKLTGFELSSTTALSSAVFCPPESEQTSKSDIWACGAILYTILSGYPPFQSKNSPEKLQTKGISFPPAIWNRVNKKAIALITRMLAKRPEQRPTAAECLKHPWIRQFVHLLESSSDPVVSSLFQLSSESPTTGIKSALIRFIISRVLPNSEIAKVAEVFSALDRNGDGVICKEEILESFRATLDEEEASKETERILALTDKNGDGKINYTEFLMRAFDQNQLLSKENLRAAFKTLDKDGSGSVSAQEMKNIFRINGTPGSQEQWHELIASFDISGDGEIDFREFRAMMRSAFK